MFIVGFGNISLVAPGQHSGAANMNMSLPVSNARDDSMHGTTNFVPNITTNTINTIILKMSTALALPKDFPIFK